MLDTTTTVPFITLDARLVGLWTMVGVPNQDPGLKSILRSAGEDTKTKEENIVSRKMKIKPIVYLFSRQVYPQPSVLSVNPHWNI
ncbi:hypothetical protein GLYMA_05G204050v4 [Glycine max]|nr:hypothetical protein GLYMA_05G204050v4 [Glycine max]KAG4391544.1 hypothetical protein GLYMA_05G204050v4 [Glycine max]KAG4391545.1 hypothetical protein GLYMA_05G204050v4 [Glycine max]KAG4391546.1 hypothetical protein GLYMA_05G204050v4 [Glycine max]KAH1135453.1 hypothetical protein GYH30_013276 [Glycine max]